MKRIILTGALTLLVSGAVFGQQEVAQKIGIIDVQNALLATKDGQKAAADLRAKFGPKDQDLQRRQGELQAKQEQLRKTQNTMSDDAKAKASADIDALGRAFQRDSEDARTDMEQEEQRITSVIGNKMLQVINKYAADNKFNLVFNVAGEPSNIISGSNGIDITREIIALYDQTNPGTEAPAAPAAAAPKK